MSEEEIGRELWRASLAATLEMRAVPDHLREGLIGYVVDRRPVGSALTAILESDLLSTWRWGDEETRAGIWAIVGWLYQEVPADCWGSAQARRAWLAGGER